MRTGKMTVECQSMLEIPLQTAEKTLRDIAKRNGQAVRKRRSLFLKQQMGDGYCVKDTNSRSGTEIPVIPCPVCGNELRLNVPVDEIIGGRRDGMLVLRRAKAYFRCESCEHPKRRIAK